jgi:hypothetical protein
MRSIVPTHALLGRAHKTLTLTGVTNLELLILANVTKLSSSAVVISSAPLIIAISRDE